MLELLSPAGDLESLKEAVNNGADAVYFGGKAFGARAYAPNLSGREIEEGIDYAHLFGRRVYITVNTLLKNNEFRPALEYVGRLYAMGADAVIVQDISLASAIKKSYPGLEVHASTQTTVHNSDSIRVLSDFDRFILARELSADQIREIVKRSDKAVEIFAHGALCFSFSGQCLMSSIIGGRSGNRGRCAQPCRKPYNSGKDPYLLSTADLCLVRRIPEIIRLGVHTVKIEGRMKPKEYVGTVTRIYRKAIDSFYSGRFRVSEKDMQELLAAFNRTFTEGFYSGADSVLAPETPTNRQLVHKPEYIIQQPHIELDVSLHIEKGKPARAVLRRGKLKIEVDSKGVAEQARTKPLEKEKLHELFSKIRSTPFSVGSFTCNVGNDAFIPFSHLAELRDASVARMHEALVRGQKREAGRAMLPPLSSGEPDSPRLLVKVYSLQAVGEAEDADIIYYNVFNRDIEKAADIAGRKLFLDIPAITYDKQIPLILKILHQVKPAGLLVGNPGLLRYNLCQEIHLSYSFNLFNDYDLFYWNHLGIISPELNLHELTGMSNKRFMVLTHGNLVVMSSRQRLSAKELRDSTGAVFPVRQNPAGYTEILNSRKIGLFSYVQALMRSGIKYFYLDLDSDVRETVALYREIISGKKVDPPKGVYTTGHLRRGVE